ncbi:MAG: dihydroxyacetone kinase subunit DhaK [Verrucomicrobia bacterium]|nr:dihydroxyacetone kinase subunit DhaK [Verrucomicrobiota bacterium]
MRYFFKESDAAVELALQGLLYQTEIPLERIGDHLGVLYRGNDRRKVKIVVGGGSGHEPLFLGMTGPGMADGAVNGLVFAAPNPDSILAVIEAVSAPEGVLVAYGNYSGDVLNFGVALEEAKAKGLIVAELRVHDDVASAAPANLEERRGISGDLFVFKLISAAADEGMPLAEVVRIGNKLNLHTRSLGVAARAATSIETGLPMFELPEGEIEIGMGLHGEMGVRRTAYETADTLVPQLIDMLIADYRATGISLHQVAAMINGLGSTTMLELSVISKFVKEALTQAGSDVLYMAAGQYACSLDMAGFSISLLALDHELTPLLSKPAASYGYVKL